MGSAARISLVVLAFVWGCSAPPPPPADVSPAPSPDVVVSLPIHPNPYTPSALFVGTLEVDGRCLFLIAEDGRRLGVAWRVGTLWNASRRSITVMGVEARAGETVHLGGGYYDIGPEDIDGTPWVNAPLPECLGDAFIFVGRLSRP
jgi:hypothetical protein